MFYHLLEFFSDSGPGSETSDIMPNNAWRNPKYTSESKTVQVLAWKGVQ